MREFAKLDVEERADIIQTAARATQESEVLRSQEASAHSLSLRA